MPLNAQQLRKWFLGGALALLVVLLAVYGYSRWRMRSLTRAQPPQMAQNVQRATQGFSLSKSEQGRTLFTVHAEKAVEYKANGHDELHDVNIIIYGKDSNRFDQIYGSDFEYDTQSGDVTAHGEVHIDLESNAEGPQHPDQAPPQVQKNLIHVSTRDLVFSQKTGVASTVARVEFHLPQASGTALGARLDSKNNVLVLQSQVALNTGGSHPAAFTAQHASITKQPRQVLLEGVHGSTGERAFDAAHAVLALDEANRLRTLQGSGGVHATETSESGASYQLQAPQAEARLGGENKFQSMRLLGGVTLDSTGPDGTHASAESADINFREDQRIRSVHATGNVHYAQQTRNSPKAQGAQSYELIADAVDLFTGADGNMQNAVTSGAARIEIQPQPSAAGAALPARTIVTAGAFNAKFDGLNHMQSLHGEPEAKIYSPNPVAGQPPRVSTSRTLDAAFNGQGTGGIKSLTQRGDFHYTSGEQQAWAEQGRYTLRDETIVLTGAPRVADASSVTTAVMIRMNRASGEAWAEDEVKTTYRSEKPQASGGMLSSSEPIHITAHRLEVSKAGGAAHYTGNVRLWQNADIVQAPAINFQREPKSMAAQGSATQPVTSVFVQSNAQGKQSPVNITAARLTYDEEQRLVVYDGNVLMRSADGMLTAKHLEITLKSRSDGSSSAAGSGPSQIEKAVASGAVNMQQPTRTATGEKLVYTDADAKYVLTGTPQHPPHVADAARGTTEGDVLTFYKDDDKVLVESASALRTVTRTHVK